MTRFTTAIATERVAAGEHRVHVDDGFWVVRGPNGGYLAAMLLAAMRDTLGDDRPPRSMTVHFMRAPEAGPATLRSEVVRSGRSLAWVRAELRQGSGVAVTAMAAFSPPWDGPTYADAVMPEAPPLSAVPERVVGRIALTDRLDARPCIHVPGRAVTGGWLRLDEPQPVDPTVAAFLLDAWQPAVFAKFDTPVAAPTVDYTVHWRTALPDPVVGDGHVLAVFRSTTAAGGFFEEDGELWSPDGRLLAQSRQLAILMPIPGA